MNTDNLNLINPTESLRAIAARFNGAAEAREEANRQFEQACTDAARKEEVRLAWADFDSELDAMLMDAPDTNEAVGMAMLNLQNKVAEAIESALEEEEEASAEVEETSDSLSVVDEEATQLLEAWSIIEAAEQKKAFDIIKGKYEGESFTIEAANHLTLDGPKVIAQLSNGRGMSPTMFLDRAGAKALATEAVWALLNLE